MAAGVFYLSFSLVGRGGWAVVREIWGLIEWFYFTPEKRYLSVHCLMGNKSGWITRLLCVGLINWLIDCVLNCVLKVNWFIRKRKCKQISYFASNHSSEIALQRFIADICFPWNLMIKDTNVFLPHILESNNLSGNISAPQKTKTESTRLLQLIRSKNLNKIRAILRG